MLRSRTPLLSLLAALALTFVLLASPTVADGDEEHAYADGAPVVLWANKVGPYHSPSVTYPFYSLPTCPPLRTRPLHPQPERLGLLLERDTLQDTGVDLPFKRDVAFAKLCDLHLDAATVATLSAAVREHYWSEHTSRKGSRYRSLLVHRSLLLSSFPSCSSCSLTRAVGISF